MSPAGSSAQPSFVLWGPGARACGRRSATARALVVTGASAPPRRNVSEYLAVAWPLTHAASGCVLTRDLVTPSQSATALRAMRSCVERQLTPRLRRDKHVVMAARWRLFTTSRSPWLRNDARPCRALLIRGCAPDHAPMLTHRCKEGPAAHSRSESGLVDCFPTHPSYRVCSCSAGALRPPSGVVCAGRVRNHTHSASGYASRVMLNPVLQESAYRIAHLPYPHGIILRTRNPMNISVV